MLLRQYWLLSYGDFCPGLFSFCLSRRRTHGFFFSGVKSDVSCKERNQIMFINNTRTYIGIETGHKRLEEVMVIFLHIYIFLNMISSRKAPAVNWKFMLRRERWRWIKTFYTSFFIVNKRRYIRVERFIALKSLYENEFFSKKILSPVNRSYRQSKASVGFFRYDNKI